jgi:hypothetical protein
MKPYLIVALTVFVMALTACQHQKQEEIQLETINHSLVNSNKLIAQNSGQVFWSIVRKGSDAIEYKSKIWLPIADTIQKSTKAITTYIDIIKLDAHRAGIERFQKEGIPEKLFKRLDIYKKILSTAIHPEKLTEDPNSQKQLRIQTDDLNRHMPVTSTAVDSFIHQLPGKNATAISLLVFLNKLQNDILISESIFMDYCHFQSRMGGCMDFDQPHAIAALNSSYVKGGDTLDISAGVGEFSVAFRPTIIIDGRKIPLSADGVAVCTKKAAQRPGRYAIPVIISFTGPDGTEQTVTRTLRYTVAE